MLQRGRLGAHKKLLSFRVGSTKNKKRRFPRGRGKQQSRKVTMSAACTIMHALTLTSMHVKICCTRRRWRDPWTPSGAAWKATRAGSPSCARTSGAALKKPPRRCSTSKTRHEHTRSGWLFWCVSSRSVLCSRKAGRAGGGHGTAGQDLLKRLTGHSFLGSRARHGCGEHLLPFGGEFVPSGVGHLHLVAGPPAFAFLAQASFHLHTYCCTRENEFVTPSRMT